MFKKILLVSVASAVLAISAQGVATPVYAQVNIKPKVKVTPKARIRVVKPKVRIRVNTDQLANKKKKDEENSKTVATIDENRRKVTPRVTTLPLIKPEVTDAENTKGLSEDQARELAQIKDLIDAMEAAKELLEVVSIGRSFSPLDPFGDALNRDEEEDKGEFETPGSGFGNAGLFGPGGMFGDQLSGAGVGSGLFNTVGPNSHKRDAPSSAPIKVTPGGIAAAIGGVASDPTRTVTRDGPVTKVVETDPDVPGDSVVTITKSQPIRQDGPNGWRFAGFDHEYVQMNGNGEVIHRGSGTTSLGSPQTIWWGTDVISGAITRFTTPGRDVTGTRSDVRPVRPGTPTQAQEDTAWGVNELRDPDSAGGGWVPSWCTGDARCGRNGPLTTVSVARLMGKVNKTLPPAPDGTQPPGHNGGTPVVSKDDLVSNYDPDSRNDGSGPTPIPTCMHSEC